MNPQIVTGILLTLSVLSLAHECLQRLGQRGQQRVLLARLFILDRKAIEWRSPMMRALGLLALMIVLAELAHDVIPGVPRPVVIALAYAAGASFVVLVGSIVWEFVGAFRMPIDKPPLKP